MVWSSSEIKRKDSYQTSTEVSGKKGKKKEKVKKL